MPATYSVNMGTQYESSAKGDITTVLKEIPDNTSKLISPRDVRDAVLTTWASSPIKQTRTIAGVEYIGIDSGNPGNRDIKQKIVLGKRSYGSLDIMSGSLLNDENVDIFVYNTRSDSASQNSTNIGFLAGTYSSLFSTAPYIGSEYNTSTGNIDFNVRNPQLGGGSINLYSNTGYVALNGIRFPKVSDNAGATDGKILRYVGNYPNGYLKWDSSNVTISQLGDVGKVTNIYGGTVSLNGYELEFVNPTMTPIAVGGVPAGFSFSATSFNGGKWPLSEVIRKILYPKVPPSISVTASSVLSGIPFVEIGTTTNINFNWDLTLYARNQYDYLNDYIITSKTGNTETLSTYRGLSFSGIPGASFSGIASLVAGSVSSPTQSLYSFNATDMPGNTWNAYPTGFSYSSTAPINHIWPIYYGMTQGTINTTNNTTITTSFNNIVKSLKKQISPYPGASGSVSLNNYSGSGYFYVIYEKNTFTTPISKMYDPNGFILHNSSDLTNSFFSATTRNGGLTINSGKTVNGQTSQWKVWVSGLTCSISEPNNFVIKF